MVSTTEAKQTSRAALALLQSHLDFELGANASVTDEELTKLLVRSGFTNEFANTVAKQRQLGRSEACEIQPARPVPLAKALLYHLRTMAVDAVDQQFDRVHEDLFAQAAADRRFTRPVEVAIDIHDWLFYGDEETDHVNNTKRQQGTNLAFRFATICVIVEGVRFCLDWRILPANDWRSKRQVVRSLVETARDVITIKHAVLDRGFYQTGVVKGLDDLDVAFLVRAPSHAGPDDRPDDGGAVVEEDYQMRQRYEPYLTATVTYAAVPSASPDDEEPFCFVTNMDVTEETASAYALAFRRRWGIETSYRKVTEFLPKTASPTFSVRLFYFSVATTLYNLWVLVNLMVTAPPVQTETPPIPAAIFKRAIESYLFEYG